MIIHTGFKCMHLDHSVRVNVKSRAGMIMHLTIFGCFDAVQACENEVRSEVLWY